MEIKIRNAYENNLKNLSVDIPLGQMTAITGVSGAGKSSLLKNILAASGAIKYTSTKSKTIRSALMISNYVKADGVENLPQTILIDAKSSVTSPSSTLATVSGIHELLRNLFVEYGECRCPHCDSVIGLDVGIPGPLVAEIACDDRHGSAIKFINENGKLIRERFYDKNCNLLASKTKAASYSELSFYLHSPSDKNIYHFNKEYQCTVLVDGIARYDPLKMAKCAHCGDIVPRLTRPRLSFNTAYDEGGGACRKCGGSGVTSGADADSLIADANKNIIGGGIRYVSSKGIQYTSVNLSMIKAAAKVYGIDLSKPVKLFASDEIYKLMYGSVEPLILNIGKGKKREYIFKGIVGSLQESYLKGRGTSALGGHFEKRDCESCHGMRLDVDLRGIRLFGMALSGLLAMTLDEMRQWCEDTLPRVSTNASVYLERLLRKTETFCRVACGHLSLDRSSATLSGGELQRIRVCTLLNASVGGLCYLLDEPSSGLHDHDIESLGSLLREVCDRGNTVVMIEHTRKLLGYCDWIVDIGPKGGKDGGALMFSDKIDSVRKYTTPTAVYLKGGFDTRKAQDKRPVFNKWIKFNKLTNNNLKNIKVELPLSGFTVVCGVSGSGKSTFLRDVLLARIGASPADYGVDGVVYLGQKTVTVPCMSAIATQLKSFEKVAKLYARSSGLAQEAFSIGSNLGKCQSCGGRGVVLSDANEMIGLCSSCGGKCFTDEVLAASVNGIGINELMSAALSDVGSIVGDDDLLRLSEICALLGIGYLSFSRRVMSLSRGELQRVRLANALSQNVRNHLFLLDEPSKGLHAMDADNLVSVIRHLTDSRNTVVAVEHNPLIISGGDYIIEFGGTGKQGGHLLYSGAPEGLSKTPTAKAIEGGKLECKCRTAKRQTKIEYETQGMRSSYDVERVHVVPQSAGELVELSSITSSEYFSVAIPGNVFYSRAKGGNEVVLSSPVVHLIDFHEKPRYDYTLYNVLGLRDEFIAIAMHEYPGDADLVRYLVDDESPTGKCGFCRGRGTAMSVPEECFLEGESMSKACSRFLKKSVCFTDTAKALKMTSGINLLKNVAMMDTAERFLLFYGCDGDHGRGQEAVKWPGLVNYFLHNHSYYPDASGASILKRARIETCPICRGKMLNAKYLKITVGDLTYPELMGNSFEWVLKKLKYGRDVHYQRIRSVLKTMVKYGLHDKKAGDLLSSMSERDSGLVRLASFERYGISQSGLVLRNLDALEGAQKKAVQKTSVQLAKTNTIFVV